MDITTSAIQVRIHNSKKQTFASKQFFNGVDAKTFLIKEDILRTTVIQVFIFVYENKIS